MGDSMDTSEDVRKPSVSGAPSEISEATKWTYCCRLVNWLYHVSRGWECRLWIVNMGMRCSGLSTMVCPL